MELGMRWCFNAIIRAIANAKKPILMAKAFEDARDIWQKFLLSRADGKNYVATPTSPLKVIDLVFLFPSHQFVQLLIFFFA